MTVRLNDAALRAKLERALLAAAEGAGARLVGHLRVKLNRSATVGRASGVARARAKRRRAAWIVQPSPPGEPPRKRTGTLQRSIAHEVVRTASGVTIRVGTRVAYGRFLERGTRKMAARPWLRPGLAEMKPRLRAHFLQALRRALAGP